MEAGAAADEVRGPPSSRFNGEETRSADGDDRYFKAEEDPEAHLPKNFMQGFLEVCSPDYDYTDIPSALLTIGQLQGRN